MKTDELKNLAQAPAKNYYKVIRTHLQKQYPALSEEEKNALCRETVFAPRDYKTEINDKPVAISTVRQTLADFIERDTSEKNFIPYSLDASIADLIEQSCCETSSMNEYYRWVSATSDIVSHTTDGDVTYHDIAERKNFINMSFDREAEILLCLALYQASGTNLNKEKIDLLRFKLARLREMRHIVVNTTNRVNKKSKKIKELASAYAEYCKKLSQEVYTSFDINLKLLNINHNMGEDLDDNYSYLSDLQSSVLRMMRMLEMPKVQNERVESNEQKQELSPMRILPIRVAEGNER